MNAFDLRRRDVEIGRERTERVLACLTHTPKSCACGRKHGPSSWALLPFVGFYEDDVDVLELRNCQCMSTLAVEVPHE